MHNAKIKKKILSKLNINLQLYHEIYFFRIKFNLDTPFGNNIFSATFVFETILYIFLWLICMHSEAKILLLQTL